MVKYSVFQIKKHKTNLSSNALPFQTKTVELVEILVSNFSIKFIYSKDSPPNLTMLYLVKV